ncbi:MULTISPECIES: hypothetical protein [Burkholderia cepacia complex]|uniref:hypothetical protein n=1 Tax=Burkholderia cepacia complex TaxID=87882 RepID=UPI000AB10C79|nr:MULTISPECIES: hypothetical protein [Burkholderia cepacia complex]MDN8070558.1 hypothetical protein [Burkholderia vietnamiensis]
MLSATSAFAEYRESWVSPAELKNLDAEQKKSSAKASTKPPVKPKLMSQRPGDQKARASEKLSSDPIAAFAHDGGGAILPRKSRAAPPPHRTKIARQKVGERAGNIHHMKTATASMV